MHFLKEHLRRRTHSIEFFPHKKSQTDSARLKMTSKSLNGSFPLSSAIFWYVVAGSFHEIVHVASMMMSMMMNKDGAFFSPNSVKANLKSFSSFALKSALGRSADLRQLFPNDEKDDDGFLLFFERSVAISRAVAVFASAILFLWSLVESREKQNTNERTGGRKRSRSRRRCSTRFVQTFCFLTWAVLERLEKCPPLILLRSCTAGTLGLFC